jgi:hypothetical protein
MYKNIQLKKNLLKCKIIKVISHSTLERLERKALKWPISWHDDGLLVHLTNLLLLLSLLFLFLSWGKNTTWPLDTNFKKKIKTRVFLLLKNHSICKRKEPICTNGYNVGRRYVALRFYFILNKKIRLKWKRKKNHYRKESTYVMVVLGYILFFNKLKIRGKRN